MEGWIHVNSLHLSSEMFIIQAVGDSMFPKIKNGDLCIFKANPVGSRQNKILLVQHSSIDSSETGGHYTIKKYNSEKSGPLDQGGRHTKIILAPLNQKFDPIIFENVDEEFEYEFHVIGEFIKVLEI
jgi:hypothetical protein